MQNLPLNELIDFFKSIFLSGMIGSGRMLGLALFFPLFSYIQLQGILRTVIVAAFSIPSITLVYQTGVPASIFEILILVVKEIMIGAVLGMLLGLPFWAAQISGDIVDSFRGASAANLFDPVHANESSVTGTFLMLYGLVLFVIIGGIPMIINILLESYAAWPSLKLLPVANTAALVELGGVALKALLLALLMAAPLLIGMAMADLAFVFAVRGARNFPIYELANAMHNMIYILLMPVFAYLFAENFPSVFKNLFDAVTKLIPNVVR